MIRIQQLELAFFGHFTNKQFDFKKRDSSRSDFHIVYGANEAGKTTFMESYLRLLYGFKPRNEPYAFRHGRANLHVSALLQIDDDERAFHRKGAGRQSLTDEFGNVLPEAAIQAHLGGLAMDDYRKLLCIDDESIDKGGEEILNSRGDIGTLLFSAAAGISDLWHVLESVRVQAESLYKPRGSSTRYAVLKKERSEVEQKIKQLDIPASKLGQFTKELESAKLAETQALDTQRTLMTRVRKLERVSNALPMLARLDESAGAVAALADYPEHLDIENQQIMELQKQLELAKKEVERLQTRQSALNNDLNQLPEEPLYSGLQIALEGLDDSHSRYRVAEQELDAEQEALSAITDKMTTIVRERFQQDVDPSRLVVDASVIKSLVDALALCKEATRLVDSEAESVKQLDLKINTEKSKLLDLQNRQVEGEGLDEILKHYNSQALSGEFRAATQSVSDAQQKLDVALDVLSIKGVRFSQLPECALSVDEAETLFEQWQALSSSALSISENKKKDQNELNALLMESDQLVSSNNLVSDENTNDLKRKRDSLWDAHKESLESITAEEFEVAMLVVDQAMQGRLAHASDLSRLREVHRQIPRLKGQVESHTESLLSTEQQIRNIESSLNNVIQAAGIDASLPPKAVLSWVRSYHEARTQFYSVQRLEKNNQAVVDKAQKLIAQLSVFIQREQATLDDLLPVASTMAEVYQRHANALNACNDTLLELHDQQATASAKHEALKLEQADAVERWSKLVQSSFTVPMDAEELRHSLDALTDLRECSVKRDSLEQRCKQMIRDKALFVEKLEQINRDNKLEQCESPESSLNQLRELAAKANKQHDEKIRLQEKLEQTLADQVVAENSLQEVQAQSSLLAGMFDSSIPTADLAQLLEAVQKTQQAAMLRAKYAEESDSLIKTVGALSEQQAREMLAELDIESVQIELAEKESELNQANETAKLSTETRTRCEEQLRALTGDGEVAKLVEHRTTLELQMSEAALEYLKLTLGHRLAEQAINRYRDKHRSSMMQATETAFSELTDGKYSRLQTQSDGSTETLLALDSSGTPKRADEMSKGTRFQLYLALRAAAYDQLAEQGTCLPFICDDIFETFDENRTRAACRVMERVGRRGQAIYLTHHRHVVDLATEVCGDQVQVHEI